MENASKALLFAAGILIAIILISVAVYIVGMANNATTGVASTMTDMELSAFNSKFTTYAGTSIAGSQVKQLIEVVNASNTQNAGTDLLVTIVKGEKMDNVTLSGSAEEGNFVLNVGSSKKYRVNIDKEDGAVKTITISGTN